MTALEELHSIRKQMTKLTLRYHYLKHSLQRDVGRYEDGVTVYETRESLVRQHHRNGFRAIRITMKP